MRHYKIISDGYILAIGTGAGGEEITVEEYDALYAHIQSRPVAPVGFGYRLKENLEWELVEMPEPVDEELVEEGDEQ